MQLDTGSVPKSQRAEQHINLTEEMKERIIEFQLSLHGVKEDTQSNYLARVNWSGIFLTQRVRSAGARLRKLR